MIQTLKDSYSGSLGLLVRKSIIYYYYPLNVKIHCYDPDSRATTSLSTVPDLHSYT